MSGLIGEARQGCLTVREIETAGERAGLESVVTVMDVFTAKLEAVLPPQVRESVLQEVTFRGIDVLAAYAEASKLPDVPTKLEGWEAVIGDAGNSKGRSILRVGRYVVQVVEAVVSER